MQTCKKKNVHFQWSFSESDNEERQAPIIQALKKTTSAPGAIGPGAFQRAWLLACCCWHLADQMMSTEIQISMRKMIKQDGWSTGDNYFHWRPLSVLFILEINYLGGLNSVLFILKKIGGFLVFYLFQKTI